MRLISGTAPCLALTLLLALLLAGCGQKGPLYLPDDKAAAERYGTPEQAQDTAEDAQKKTSELPENRATESPASDNERDS